MTTKIKTKWMMITLATVVLASGVQAAYVITRDGKKLEGSDIRAKSNGDIILTTSRGTTTIAKGQYKKAVADKPASLDQAVTAIRDKAYDKAEKLLKDILKQYRYLDWDNKAMTLLARLYRQQGQYAEAADTYEKLFASSDEAKANSELQWEYRETLFEGKQYDKLEPILNRLVKNGPREDAAKAQIMRGDIELEKGQAESALIDYMRTVVLFKNEADLQPEALYKAAGAMEAMRDKRAQVYYEKIITDYPSSPYADKAKEKLKQ